MGRGVSVGAVAWGLEHYDAAQDAASALVATPRAGAPAAHHDDDDVVRAAADRLLGLPFTTWGFGDSVAFEALVQATDVLGDERWARFAHGWGRAWVTRSRPFARLDCTVPGRALVGLAERYEDARLLTGLRDLANYLMERPRLDDVFETWERSPLLAPYGGLALDATQQALLDSPPAGVFVDCLHFDPPFLTELGRVTGEARYIDAGAAQALGYIRLLQQSSGLFDHFALRGVAGTFGPGWGRGQGWAMLGLLETAESLRRTASDASHRLEQVELLEHSARQLLTAMIELQRPDGHWFAVVTDPTSGDEFSTAAFMAAALARALRAGVIEGEAAMGSQGKARQAVLTSLDNAADLREVSAAVYASTEPGHYAHVPRGYVVPWGQGPAVLALLSEPPR